MDRQQKEFVVASLREKIKSSRSSFVVGLQGLSVAQIQVLRRELRVKGGALKVAKGRLMKIAVDGVGQAEALRPFFKNQIGLVTSSGNPSDIAKVLDGFSHTYGVFDIVGGIFDAQILSKNDVVLIASLPSREILLARVCGSMQAPVANMTRLLNMLVLRFLFVLQKIAEKK